MRRSLIAVGAVTALGLAASPAHAEDKHSTTRIAEAVHAVHVDVPSGHITVRPGSSTVVDLVEHWDRQEPEVSVSVKNGVLTVSSRCRGLVDGPIVFISDFGRCSTDVVVTVAAPGNRVDTTLETSSGNVALTGLDGTHVLSASSGSVTASKTRGGSLKLSSSSGNVSARDARTMVVDMHASSGDVLLQRVVVGSKLTARTSGGNITVADVTAKQADLDTSSGDVLVTLLRTKGLLKATTSGGNVKLQHVKAPELSAGTSSGDVDIAGSSVRVVRATTSGGSVGVRGTSAVSYDLGTSSGNVAVDSPVTPNRIHASTSGGDIAVTVPRGSYDLALNQNGGKVTLDKITPDRTSPHRLELSTSSGDITVIGR